MARASTIWSVCGNFLKKKGPLWKKVGAFVSWNRSQLRIMTALVTGHCHLKAHLFKMGPVNSPSVTCKQASRTSSHVPCDCEALVTLTFRCLSGHFMQLSDWKHLYQQDATLCSRCRAARCRNAMAAQRMSYGWSAWVSNVPSLLVLMSCPFYSYCDFYVWFRPFLFITTSSGTQLGIHIC